MIGIGETLLAMNILGVSAAGLFWQNPELVRKEVAAKVPAMAAAPAAPAPVPAAVPPAAAVPSPPTEPTVEPAVPVEPAAEPSVGPAAQNPVFQPDEAGEPTPMPYSDQKACTEELAKYGIFSHKDFLTWSKKNHPDKGGDPRVYAHVSECDRNRMYAEKEVCTELPKNTPLVTVRGDGLCFFRTLVRDENPDLKDKEEETAASKALARRIVDELKSKPEYREGAFSNDGKLNVQTPDGPKDMTFDEYVDILPDGDETGIYAELEIVGLAASRVIEKNIAVYVKLKDRYNCVMHYPVKPEFETTVSIVRDGAHFNLLEPPKEPEEETPIVPYEQIPTPPSPIVPYAANAIPAPPAAAPPAAATPEIPSAASSPTVMPPETPFSESTAPPAPPVPAPLANIRIPGAPPETPLSAVPEESGAESTGPANSDVSRLSDRGRNVRDKIRRIIQKENITGAINKLLDFKKVVAGLATPPVLPLLSRRGRGGVRSSVPSVVMGLSQLDAAERRVVYNELKEEIKQKYDLTDGSYEEEFVKPLEDSVETFTGSSSASRPGMFSPNRMSRINEELQRSRREAGLTTPSVLTNPLVQQEQTAETLERAAPFEQVNPMTPVAAPAPAPVPAAAPPTVSSLRSQLFPTATAKTVAPAIATLGSEQNPVNAQQRMYLGLPPLTKEQKLYARKILGMKAGTRRHRGKTRTSTFRRKRKTDK
uniref:OTU domain-containing protein n=1 Tax=viral metagenome TaxID=1070528 RepID=A0A6C0J896_9ZZZZ